MLKIILFLSMAIASLPSFCMETDYFSDEESSAIQQGFSLFDPVNNTDENCAICRDTIELDGLKLEPCNHLFHTACMNQHLHQSGTTCPLCRAEPTNIPNLEQLKSSHRIRQQYLALMDIDRALFGPPRPRTYADNAFVATMLTVAIIGTHYCLSQPHTLLPVS